MLFGENFTSVKVQTGNAAIKRAHGGMGPPLLKRPLRARDCSSATLSAQLVSRGPPVPITHVLDQGARVADDDEACIPIAAHAAWARVLEEFE